MTLRASQPHMTKDMLRGQGRLRAPYARLLQRARKQTLSRRCNALFQSANATGLPTQNSSSLTTTAGAFSKTQQEQEGEEAAAELQSLKEKGNEKERGMALFQFCLVNPTDAKYQRKQLFDLLGCLRQRYAKTCNEKSSGDRPMTREVFKTYCEDTLGLEKEEWEGWWDELYNEPRVERNRKGFRGREQLWIPLGEERSGRRIKGVADIVQESNQP